MGSSCSRGRRPRRDSQADPSGPGPLRTEADPDPPLGVRSAVRFETVLPEWMPPRATCHRGCPLLDLAVGLAWLGYAPIPLGEGKRPLVKWGAYHVNPPGWREL